MESIFDTAPIVPLKVKPRRKAGGRGGNVYMLLAVTKNRARQLVEENFALLVENDRLRATTKRLQDENDALWEYHRQQRASSKK